MKNILIMQNNGSTSGGVWSVNKTLAQKFQEKGYDVLILAIREAFDKKAVPQNLEVYTLNKNDKWAVPTKRDVLNTLKKGKIIKAIKQFMQNKEREIDIKKAKTFIRNYDPDYIIVSQYQILDGIPKEYLAKTINVHHNSFNRVLNIKTLLKYNNLVKFCWLSEGTMNKAKKYGLNNNFYIYNPVKFNTSSIANVKDNKKLIVLTRLVQEKRIDLMIKIVEDVFKDSQYQDWIFEIYGTGILESEIRKTISNKKQIILKEVTDDAQKAYLNASINLNTSDYEGFPMSILEANECGVPTVTFNYGEAVNEQVIDGKTGFVVKQDDLTDYTNKLKLLMDDKKLLTKMSKECKKYNQKFYVDNIIKDWEKLFGLIDKK